MSPLALLYVKVGSFNFLSLSGYDILGIPGIILVALFWTLSNFSRLYLTFYVVTILSCCTPGVILLDACIVLQTPQHLCP